MGLVWFVLLSIETFKQDNLYCIPSTQLANNPVSRLGCPGCTASTTAVKPRCRDILFPEAAFSSSSVPYTLSASSYTLDKHPIYGMYHFMIPLDNLTLLKWSKMLKYPLVKRSYPL